MYTESSFKGRKIRIAGRKGEEQKHEEPQRNNAKEVSYQAILEAKEKVKRSLQRSVSYFSYNRNNMMCILGTKSDEILREVVEEVKHSVFGHFIMMPKTKLNGTDSNDVFTLFVEVITNFIKNAKFLELGAWETGRLYLFRSKINDTAEPVLKGNICNEFLRTIINDRFGGHDYGFRLIWNVEIDADNINYNQLEHLSQIACEKLLIIVTSDKTIGSEMDLYSEDIIRIGEAE